VEVFQNEEVTATPGNLDALRKERKADLITCQGPTKAKDWYRNSTWDTVDGQKVYVNHVKKAAKKLYMAVCTRAAYDVAKEIEYDDIRTLFELFRSQFASVEPEQVEEKIKQKEKGLMPDSSAVSMADFFLGDIKLEGKFKYAPLRY